MLTVFMESILRIRMKSAPSSLSLVVEVAFAWLRVEVGVESDRMRRGLSACPINVQTTFSVAGESKPSPALDIIIISKQLRKLTNPRRRHFVILEGSPIGESLRRGQSEK